MAICISAYAGGGTEEGIEEIAGLINVIMADSGISQPEFIAALIAFIAFNMTTIPCFAACATAKAELPKGKFKWTLLFWIAVSYTVGAMIYTIGSWWWTLFIWFVVIAAAVVLIVLKNLNIFDIAEIFRRKKKDGKDK